MYISDLSIFLQKYHDSKHDDDKDASLSLNGIDDGLQATGFQREDGTKNYEKAKVTLPTGD